MLGLTAKLLRLGVCLLLCGTLTDSAASLPQPESTQNAIAGASALYAEGDLSGAIHALRRGLAGDPENPRLHFMLGNALYRDQDWAGAIRHYRLAAKIRPHHTDTHLGLGFALFHAAEVAEAVDAWRTAARQTPQDALVHLSLAIGLLTREDLSGAGRHLARAMELDPRWKERLVIDIRWTPGMIDRLSELARNAEGSHATISSRRNERNE